MNLIIIGVIIVLIIGCINVLKRKDNNNQKDIMEDSFGNNRPSENIPQEETPQVNLAINEIVKAGLTIKNGMVVDIRKEGSYFKAYNDAGDNYSSVISNNRRKKAWEQKKSLKAKISQVTNLYEKEYRITWSLVRNTDLINNLIKKYGQEDGMLIFEGKISEKEYIHMKELIKKYGEKFGIAVFNKKVHKKMTLEMVENCIGKHKYQKGQIYYFGKPFNKRILFKEDLVENIEKLKEGIWLDMPKSMLIASYGRPRDEKKEVSKKGIKLKWYYDDRTTQRGTTVYKYEMRLENDLVVGWKELE